MWNKQHSVYIKQEKPQTLSLCEKAAGRLIKAFGQNLLKKVKTEKTNIIIKIYIFQIVWVPKFSLNWQSWFLD